MSQVVTGTPALAVLTLPAGVATYADPKLYVSDYKATSNALVVGDLLNVYDPRALEIQITQAVNNVRASLATGAAQAKTLGDVTYGPLSFQTVGAEYASSFAKTNMLMTRADTSKKLNTERCVNIGITHPNGDISLAIAFVLPYQHIGATDTEPPRIQHNLEVLHAERRIFTAA
jgi:hypothetical protein